MNQFILVTDQWGKKIAIRIRDIIEVEKTTNSSPLIWYCSKLWKRGKKAIPLGVQESIEEICTMLNGGDFSDMINQEEKAHES